MLRSAMRSTERVLRAQTQPVFKLSQRFYGKITKIPSQRVEKLCFELLVCKRLFKHLSCTSETVL